MGPVVSEKKIQNRHHPFDTCRPLGSFVCFRSTQNIYCLQDDSISEKKIKNRHILASCIFWNRETHHFLKDHPLNITTKFGSNWPGGFREEDSKQITPCLTPLNLLFLVYFRSTKKTHNLCRLGDHQMHIPIKVWFQCWLQ